MMQLEFLLDFLYSYFLPIFFLMVGIVVIMSVTLIKIIVSKIQTKIFIFKKNTLEIIKGKEDNDGSKIRSKGRIILRKNEPYICKTSFNIWRVFLIREGENITTELEDNIKYHITSDLKIQEFEDKKQKDKDKDKKVAWSTIFESEAIKQAIAGIVQEMRNSLIQILAGIGIGVIATLIIFALTGKL